MWKTCLLGNNLWTFEEDIPQTWISSVFIHIIDYVFGDLSSQTIYHTFWGTFSYNLTHGFLEFGRFPKTVGYHQARLARRPNPRTFVGCAGVSFREGNCCEFLDPTNQFFSSEWGVCNFRRIEDPALRPDLEDEVHGGAQHESCLSVTTSGSSWQHQLIIWETASKLS